MHKHKQMKSSKQLEGDDYTGDQCRKDMKKLKRGRPKGRKNRTSPIEKVKKERRPPKDQPQYLLNQTEKKRQFQFYYQSVKKDISKKGSKLKVKLAPELLKQLEIHL